MTRYHSLLALILAFGASTAQADLLVTFRDGAPKDRFSLTLEAGCPLEATEVAIDLAPAPAGLLFDVTAAGAGVEVFQPFEVVSGGAALSALPVLRDGDQAVVLPIARLDPGQSLTFTTDVDDTLSSRGITVSGSEIAGATVRIGTASAPFGTDGTARVPLAACLS